MFRSLVNSTCSCILVLAVSASTIQAAADSPLVEDLTPLDLIIAAGPALSRDSNLDYPQVEALADMRAMQDEILALVDSAISVDAGDALLPVGEYLWVFLNMTSQSELQRDLCSRILEYAQAKRDTELEVYARIGLSSAQFRLGEYIEAGTQASTAEVLADSLGDKRAQSTACRYRGLAAKGMGELVLAESHARTALQYANSMGSQPGIALATNLLGLIAHARGELDTAKRYYQKAAEMFLVIDDDYNVAIAQNNLANIAGYFGEWESALDLHAKVLDERRQLEDRYGEAASLANLGWIELELGNDAAAKSFIAQALLVADETGAVQYKSVMLFNSGRLARYRGDYEMAQTLFSQSRDLDREIGSVEGEIWVGCAMAMLELEHGRPEEARQTLDQLSSKIDPEDGPHMAARFEESCALLDLAAGEFGSAARNVHSSLKHQQEAVDHYGYLDTLVVAGSTLVALGDLENGVSVLRGTSIKRNKIPLRTTPIIAQVESVAMETLESAIATGSLPAEEAVQLELRGTLMSNADLAALAIQSLEQALERLPESTTANGI